MPPVIAITCNSRLSTPLKPWQRPMEQDYQNRDYCLALRQAGGIPVLIPCTGNPSELRELLGRVDGVVLAGGDDLDPRYFGETAHPLMEFIDVPRDALDKSLVGLLMSESGLPVLGVCRGAQVLNVFCSGSLYQDASLYEGCALQHRQQTIREYATHEVELAEGSRLERICGQRRIWVNSFHHQLLKQVASEFRVVGKAPDGTVEAIEQSGERFVVGVGWHPEHLVSTEDHARRLFRALVEAAGN